MPTEQLIVSISEKGALVVKRNIEGVGRSSATASKGVHLLKGALAALGIASAAMVTISSVKLLANFSQEMSTIKAITGATGKEFEALRETAKSLGETTRFTASQAAQAMVNLSRAGFTAKETIESVDDTLRLAQAGALELADAARITTQVMRGFGMGTDQAGHIVDVLAKAANSANTDVMMLGEGLKFVAPIARGLNVGLEETTAVLQALADAGLRSTLGGTGLRMMLAKLEAPTGRANAVLDELGLTADQISVQTHGLTNVLRLLSERGLTTSQAMQIFGTRAGAAGSVATSMANALVNMTDELRNAGGYAEETSRIMDDNLNGALLRAKSAIEAVIIETGDLGQETALTTFLNDFAKATRWVAHNMEILDKITKILAVTLSVMFAKRALLAAKAGMIAFGKSITKLYATLQMNPFTIWLTIIAAVLAALYVFRNEINVFGNDFVTLGDVGSSALDEIKKSFGLMKDDVKSDMEEMGTSGDDTLANLSQFALSMLQVVLQVVDKIVGSITGIFNGIYRGVTLVIKKIKGDKVSWEEIGLGFSEEVIAGMTSSNLEDKLLAVIDGATENALKRQKDAVAEVVAKGKEATPEVKPPPALVTPETADRSFEDITDSLKLENELLALNRMERSQRLMILDIEAELETELNSTQKELIAGLVSQNEQLQIQADLLEDIKGPQELFNAQVVALNALLAREEGGITLEEYNNKLGELKENLKSTMDESGLQEAIGGALFDNASAALNEFISGGKVEFGEFARSIIADIARITAKMLMLKAFEAIGLPGFQHGGSFRVGGQGGPDSQLVAFKASPQEHVTITKPGQTPPAAQAGAVSMEPRITIVNDIDPAMTLEAMSSEAGGKVIMNFIQKNKGTIRRQLGG